MSLFRLDVPKAVPWYEIGADIVQLTGQRKKESTGDNSLASNFSGLRPSYW